MRQNDSTSMQDFAKTLQPGITVPDINKKNRPEVAHKHSAIRAVNIMANNVRSLGPGRVAIPHLYAGTVDGAVKADRRAKNKRARKARRANRKG